MSSSLSATLLGSAHLCQVTAAPNSEADGSRAQDLGTKYTAHSSHEPHYQVEKLRHGGITCLGQAQ